MQRFGRLLYHCFCEDEMTTAFCACGNPDGTNQECERCRLIAQLTAAETLIATMEAAHDLQLRLQAELNADLRTASDQCEAMARDNTRLRELLKQCREYVPVDLQDFIDGATK
jgi:hypothetical protein